MGAGVGEGVSRGRRGGSRVGTDAAPILRLTRASFREGTDLLRARDRRLGRWIERLGPVPLRRQPHHFGALCRSIIAQQVSAQAARSIYVRFVALFAPDRSPSPGRLLAMSPRALAACGLSRPKVAYLEAVAREFVHGDLRRLRLSRLPDEEVVAVLTRLPGVGVWTAEMFLIFALGRQDVFSTRDLALCAGVQRVEGRALSAAEIGAIAGRWRPYRSVASLYLWRIAHWKER
jgi:DNA-3-methyladenine glycosylase II